MSNTRFQVGQVVKLRSGWHGKSETLVRIAKVWKNGVVEIGALPDETPRFHGQTFNSNGQRRGNGSGNIYPLDEGETVENIRAAHAAAAVAAKAEQDAKDRKHAAEVDEWWNAAGQAMWTDRQVIKFTMLDELVNVIKFEKHGEVYMPFVIIQERTRFNGERELEATVGGLHGREYPDSLKPGTTHKSISTYSSSTVTGQTLEAVLYSVTH